MTILLSDSEKLAFAGLVRVLIRLSGDFTPDEREAVGLVGAQFFLRDGAASAYRTSSDDTPDAAQVAVAIDEMWALVDRAGETFADDDAVQEAALGVERQEAREAMYTALAEIARTDTISVAEMGMLDWLKSAWNVTGAGLGAPS
jgi:hypothetical protein